jgi:hypothetical protein
MAEFVATRGNYRTFPKGLQPGLKPAVMHQVQVHLHHRANQLGRVAGVTCPGGCIGQVRDGSMIRHDGGCGALCRYRGQLHSDPVYAGGQPDARESELRRLLLHKLIESFFDKLVRRDFVARNSG